MKPRDAFSERELEDVLLREEQELAEFDWFAENLLRVLQDDPERSEE